MWRRLLGWWRARKAPVVEVEEAPLPDPLLDEFIALQAMVDARKERERRANMTDEERMRERMQDYSAQNIYRSQDIGYIGLGGYAPQLHGLSNQFNQQYARQYDQQLMNMQAGIGQNQSAGHYWADWTALGLTPPKS